MQSRRDAGRRYGVIVGVEFALAGLGADILLPLAPLLRDRRLVALGVLVTIVALVALVAGLADTVAPSAVTGVGAGLLLLAFAVAELAGTVRNRA